MRKKVLIVHAHPESASLTRQFVDEAVQTLDRQGHEVMLTDLYGMHWKAVFDGHDFPDRIDPARLSFAARTSLAKFHQLHHGVDIALDAHPYSGATTTLESLWMGVPTLTLASDAPISRSTASILATLGLDDWIARTAEQFIAAAQRHARAPERLAQLRGGLRAAVEASAVMNGERFVPQVEALYREMWDA